MPLALRHPLPTLPRLRYPQLWVWLLTFAALDVVVTSAVLRIGGSELNVIALAVIEGAGLAGMVLLKLAGTLTVLTIGEYVARTRATLARRLLVCAISVNILAVAKGSAILGFYGGMLIAAL